jgi:hypothetical protein
VAGPLERARAGDPGAFIELVRANDAEARRRAADEQALLSAYVAAYRALPGYGGEPALEEWLAGFVDRPASGRGLATTPGFWNRLAEALTAEAPALAAPQLPERRWPVLPRLQRRRRLQGPR